LELVADRRLGRVAALFSEIPGYGLFGEALRSVFGQCPGLNFTDVGKVSVDVPALQPLSFPVNFLTNKFLAAIVLDRGFDYSNTLRA
jgi:hypothetical protein